MCASPLFRPDSADARLFRFTLFWEKTILIIKEVEKGRIKLIREVDG